MSLTRKKSRLFPVASPCIAVSAEQTDDPNETMNLKYAHSYSEAQANHQESTATHKKKIKTDKGKIDYSYSCYDSKSMAGYTKSSLSVGHYSDTEPCILPNGYYFYTGSPTHQIRLGNILAKSGPVDSNIDEDLDPALAAVITDRPERHQLTGVNKVRNEVFLYTLEPAPYITINLYPTPETHSLESYRLSRHADTASSDQYKTLSGTSIYKTEDEKKSIVSIAGFPGLKDPLLAVALNTGDIVLGRLIDNKLSVESNFISPVFKENTKVSLLSSPTGLLIAHYPDKNKLCIWNLKNNQYNFSEYSCPAIYNLSTSVSGDYLTGLECQNGKESNKIHCFKLQHFKHDCIQLPNPVADFVIGAQDQVATMKQNDKFEFFGSNDKLVELLGSVDNLFFKKSIRSTLSSLFHPKPNEAPKTDTLERNAHCKNGVGF